MNKWHYVYVLLSEIDHHFYVVYTTDLRKRLDEHKAGKVLSTKKRLPVNLVIGNVLSNQADATRRERYLKTAWGKRYIRSKLKNLSHGVNSQPGPYFITICTKDQLCTLGYIVTSDMRLSQIGKIADDCWKEIPQHFPIVRLDTFVIMPNHLHGIINIKNAGAPITKTSVGVEYIQPLPARSKKRNRYQHLTPKSVRSIVRSFKAAVTRKVHDDGLVNSQSV